MTDVTAADVTRPSRCRERIARMIARETSKSMEVVLADIERKTERRASHSPSGS